MSKLARAAVALLLPVAVLLAGCTADPADDDADPAPTISIAPSTPAAPVNELPEIDEIPDWAAVALPEDRAGAPAAVVRATGPIKPAAAVIVDIEQAAGMWDLVMTCQSVDGSPLQWRIESPSVVLDEPVELDCTTPNGGVPTTSVVGYDGVGAQLQLTATNEAIYAVEVRPHSAPLD